MVDGGHVDQQQRSSASHPLPSITHHPPPTNQSQVSNLPRVRKFIASVVARAVTSTRYRASAPSSPQSFIRSHVRQIESISARTIGRGTPVQYVIFSMSSPVYLPTMSDAGRASLRRRVRKI